MLRIPKRELVNNLATETRYELTLTKIVNKERVERNGVALKFTEPMEVVGNDLFFAHLRAAMSALIRHQVRKRGIDPLLDKSQLDTYKKWMGGYVEEHTPELLVAKSYIPDSH